MRGVINDSQVIEKIREEYRDGFPVAHIAKWHRCSSQTVNGYCEDIEKPAPLEKMTDLERSEHLRNWK